MISDYWLYQKRDVQTPWALYLVKEYDRRHLSATVLDYTLYHEDIDTPTKSISRVGLHHDTVGGYVNDIVNDILEFAEIHSEDREQLERFILEVLTS